MRARERDSRSEIDIWKSQANSIQYVPFPLHQTGHTSSVGVRLKVNILPKGPT